MTQPSEGLHAEDRTTLKPKALSLTAVLMQGVATISPGFAIVATFQFTVSNAGLAAPLAYGLAFLLVACLAVTVGQLAKAFPSAGGWYTYISGSISPRLGFLSGWIMTIWLPPAGVLTIAYFADNILAPATQAQWGWSIPWWLFTVVIMVLVLGSVYLGVSVSQNLVVVLGSLEILIMVILAVTGVLKPGSGGVNASPFNPSSALSGQGLYLAVVFSLFAFSGWEAVAPMAEESKKPRQYVQWGLIGAVTILGVYFMFTSWGYLIGLGTNNVSGIITNANNPVFQLAQEHWGNWWVLVLFALVNSVIAVGIACANASTRMWFGMARSGSLPSSLARVNPKRKTPDNAIHVQVGVATLSLVIALIWGTSSAFNVWALTITIGLILVYIVACAGAVRYYWFGVGRPAFNPLLHLVLPIIGAFAAAWVGYKSLVPLPAPPSKYAPIFLLAWILIGVGVIVALKVTGRDAWLDRAGLAMSESEFGVDPEVVTGAFRGESEEN